MNQRRLLLAAGLAIVASPLLATLAGSWPDRPIRMILPFPAGSATDGATRLIMEEVRKGLGQPVIVENQAGADGIIAAQNAKRAAPDGYTLFVSTNSAHGANPALYKSLPYDPEKDFEPIAGLIRIPLTLCVPKDFPADDVAGFVKVARQKAATKPLTFGSGNTSSRVAAELFRSATKIELAECALQRHAAGPAGSRRRPDRRVVRRSLFGHGIDPRRQAQGPGHLGQHSHPMLPTVPTLGEAGYSDCDVVSFAAVFAPARTEPAIIDRLNEEINAALARPDIVEGIGKMGDDTDVHDHRPRLRAFVRSEIAAGVRLVELAGIPKK